MQPTAKRLFLFMKDTDEVPQNNPRVKSHAIKVFKMTCEAAIQLREKGKVVVSGSTLKYLGSVHFQKGIADRHFVVVKKGVLRTVQKGVGEKWSEEMKGAWSEAYDQLAAAILDKMKKEAAKTNS
ncbi:anaerobic nitrite reductase HB2-like [Rutidosis leptorrhynchoides]|uniref:anaerobic nitrite reductase HB2-like n=1 Tax=Rutidosis leptorrhynchoides TaxID=125765 RepID=UPI003A99A7C5